MAQVRILVNTRLKQNPMTDSLASKRNLWFSRQCGGDDRNTQSMPKGSPFLHLFYCTKEKGKM